MLGYPSVHQPNVYHIGNGICSLLMRRQLLLKTLTLNIVRKHVRKVSSMHCHDNHHHGLLLLSFQTTLLALFLQLVKLALFLNGIFFLVTLFSFGVFCLVMLVFQCLQLHLDLHHLEHTKFLWLV
jgi:hypothetical protein